METGHRPHRSLHRIRKNSGCARIEADGIRKSGGRKRGAARDRTCSPSLANRIYICWRAQRSEKSKPDETLRSSVQLRKEGEEEVLLGGQDKEDLPPLTRRELFVNLKLSRLEIGQSIPRNKGTNRGTIRSFFFRRGCKHRTRYSHLAERRSYNRRDEKPLQVGASSKSWFRKGDIKHLGE